MEPAESRRHVSVQMEESGVLNRSAGCSGLSCRRKVRGQLAEAGRSLLMFLFGLLLASVYGVTALFLQKQPLWLCVHIMLVVAGLAAFSMGLSQWVRVNVMVMLPSLCSAHGRTFVLLLFMSVLLSGPLTNILENTKQAASSLLCGAELAANQTQELMQRAATPLFSALDQIREISSNAYAVAGRVQKLIQALTDNVQHVARTLRNVLHFLVDIGDICNAELGSPYRKCRALFAEAQSDCSNLLGDFNFLCDIMDGFLPLCSLARAGELFCIIPSYVASQLKERLAAPTIAAFQKMKQEFDFNISAIVTSDLDMNSSRSLQQVSQDIMDEVSSDLQVFQKLSEPLMYGCLVLLALSFLRAVRYRRRYLRQVDFDNIYISAQFVEFDQLELSRGGASVLPLTRREAKTYITPLSLRLTDREVRVVLLGVASVLRHLVLGGVLVAMDFLVFWILDQVHHQVKGDVLGRAPVQVAVQVNGSGYASDIFRDLVASFSLLQRGNITVISRKCLLEPLAPNHNTCFILGFLLGLALLISLTAGFMQRCRRLICASYHPETELERIQFLHQHILQERRAASRAFKSFTSGGGRGGRGGSRLHTLLTQLAVRLHLSHFLDPSSSITCASCAEALVPEGDDTLTCDHPHCSGVYCRPCFHSLGNTCVVCAQALTCQEEEEELDSSDDEQPHPSHTLRVDRRTSTGTFQGDSEGDRDSEADMRGQDQHASDECDSDASFQSATTSL
ncbi:DC-STAMP domain-containing protein 2 [Parambassis ranga]|uniref:DC-STAMP domain-containing protein 2 n=1 Tax=Parambassis ranga TaxID=210632 RepID=A0A6P7HLJ7_9TELE|nr:DC-STAMP domain-containing protein 2 [Parambassis ranga]